MTDEVIAESQVETMNTLLLTDNRSEVLQVIESTVTTMSSRLRPAVGIKTTPTKHLILEVWLL